jgi:integrase
VEQAIQKAEEESLSASYRNLMFTAGRGFFDWAQRTGKPLTSTIHPFTGVRTNRRSPEESVLGISRAEFDSIIKTVETIDAENWRGAIAGGPKTANLPWVNDDSRLPKKTLPVKLMFFGGLRISEAVSLKVKNVQEHGITVEGARRERFVPLPRWLMRGLTVYIRRFTDDTVYVFTPIKTSR